MSTKITPTHPGKVIRDEYLKPYGINAKAVAQGTHIPESGFAKSSPAVAASAQTQPSGLAASSTSTHNSSSTSKAPTIASWQKSRSKTNTTHTHQTPRLLNDPPPRYSVAP